VALTSSTAFGGGGLLANGTAELNGNSLSVANLTGTGNVQNGSGTLTIATVNSFNGGTTINAGNVVVNSVNGLGTGPLLISGGSLALNAAGAVSSTTINAGSVLVNSASGLGTGALTLGGGTLALNAVNPISSATVSGGVLQLGANSVGAAGSLTSGPVGTTTLTVSGAVLSSVGTAAYTLNNAINFTGDSTLGDPINNGSLSLGGAITLTGSRTLTVNSPVTMGGAIGQDAAGRSLTKAGSGNLTLNAAETYTGPTIINGGTLTVNAVPSSGTVSIASGATLQMNCNYVPTVTGSGTWNVAPGSSGYTYTVGAVSAFSGTTNIASGVRYWPNAQANVPGGTIVVANGGQFCPGYYGTITANMQIAGSSWVGGDIQAALRLNPGSGAVGGNLAGTLTLNANAGVAAFYSGGAGTISANIGGPYQLNIVTGAITFSGTNALTTFTGLLFNGGAALLGLNKTGAGMFTLTNPNSYRSNEATALPSITPVPEPGTLVLVVAGVAAGLATWRRRRNRSN